MNVLAIDTATEACSAALSAGGAVRQRFEVVGRSHTERLLPMVHELLAEAGLRFAQLDALVCGIGPGSFAGVRIGVGFVKGAALAIDRPVVGVSSLAMLALPALRAGASQVLSVIDARMNEVYWAGYGRDADGLPQILLPEIVAAPEQVGSVPGGEWVGVGSGWRSYEAALRAASGAHPVSLDGDALPVAADALAIALPQLRAERGVDAGQLVPAYLRDKVALTLSEQQQLREQRAK